MNYDLFFYTVLKNIYESISNTTIVYYLKRHKEHFPLNIFIFLTEAFHNNMFIILFLGARGRGGRETPGRGVGVKSIRITSTIPHFNLELFHYSRLC